MQIFLYGYFIVKKKIVCTFNNRILTGHLKFYIEIK